MDINVVIQKLIMLLFIMILGYIAKKKKILTDEYTKGFSILIVNITLPCLLVSSMLSKGNKASTKEILYIIFLGTIIFGSMVLISNLIVKIFKASPSQDGIYRFCTMQNNNIFMGFPIIESLLGASSLFYAAILNIPSSIYMFSLGIFYIKRYKTKEKLSPYGLINIGIITSITCTILYLSGFTLPLLLQEGFSSVGNMTVPLSMIVLGACLANIPFKEVITEKKLYLFALIKMVLIPFVFFYLISVTNLSKDILYTIIITLAMPGPTLCVSLAIEYEADVDLASKYVFLSTVLSLITIPIVIKLII